MGGSEEEKKNQRDAGAPNETGRPESGQAVGKAKEPARRRRYGLDVVVELEFVGVRAHADGVRFVFDFVVDPEVDDVFGEDVALE